MTGVYIASAIDQATSPADYAWVPEWVSGVDGVSWVFDPKAAFRVGHGAKRGPAIRAINSVALDRAGMLIALLPAGAVSVGVPMEIERAASSGKPTLVISDAPAWMLEYDLPNVTVLPSWNEQARNHVRETLRGIPEGTGAPGRALMPVVVDEGAEAPRRGYDDDAGLDLVVSEDREVLPGHFVDIPCGVSVQLPDWAWGMITGRSSTLRKRGLMVNQGIIDAGYRGPLFAGVWNLTGETVKVVKGERIAQLLVLENGTRKVEVHQTTTLTPGSRGSAGFGSTGV